MPIIWRLRDGVKRYGALGKSLPKITHKMLRQQLRELEDAGLISRKVYPKVPPKVEYALTQEGETILPIIDMFWEWGYEYKNR